MRRSSDETRNHVLSVARDLFYWHGIRAIGVDRIVAEAGIAPTTLYRLFGSKDDLVAAYVARNADDYRAWFDHAVESGGTDPRDRIHSVFEALHEQVRPEACRGCPFLMALAEFPDETSVAHQHAVELKSWVRSRFGELTAALAEVAEIDDPGGLADWLTLTMEGVYASVQAVGAEGPAQRAGNLVAHILPMPTRARRRRAPP